MPSTISRAASRFCAGPGAERNAAAPALNREVLEIAELLDLAQGVDAGLAGQIQQRLGADADIRVAQHGRHALGDLVVAAGAQGGQRTAADVGIGMRQQRPQRRMPLARLLPFDEVERVADLGQIGGRKLRREHVRRGAFGHRRGAALGVETMAVNAVLDRADILRAQPPRQRQPDRDGHEVDRRRAAQIEMQAGQHEEALRQQPEHHRADGVGDAIDDDVDGVLDRGAIAGRNRQIEQLVGRLVDARTGAPDRMPLVSSTLQNAGASRIRKLPVAIASGSARMAAETPQCAKHTPGDQQLHAESCRRR